MAVKISELPTSSLITSDDVFPMVDGTSLITQRTSAQNILKYITGSNIDTLSVSTASIQTANITSIVGTLTGNLVGTSSYSENSNLLDGINSSDFARLSTSNTFANITTFSNSITGTSAYFSENLYVNGTASFAFLNTVSQSSLVIGDKYITILSGGTDHVSLDGSGILWGSGSSGPTVNELGANAHLRFRNSIDSLEIFPGLYVSGSTSISGNLNVTGSTVVTDISGANATFTVITASNLSVSGGNLIIYETASIGDYAYILYNSTYDKLVAFPGLYISGNLTASANASFQLISGTNAQFTQITGSTAYFSGNVGIGIVNPAFKVDVRGGTTADLYVGTNDTTAVYLSASNTGVGGYSLYITADGSGAKMRTNSSVRDLQLGTNSTTALTIDTSQNVGIGTTTPTEKLHVKNNNSVYTLVENTLDTGYSSVQTKNDGGTYIQMFSVATNQSGDWFVGNSVPLNRKNTVGFRTGGTESALVFAAQANVPLHIGQNDTTRLLFNTSEASFNHNKLNYNFRVAGDADDNAIFVSANSDRVGIGTSTPNAKLDVNGNTIISGSLTVTGSTTLTTVSGTTAQFTTVNTNNVQYGAINNTTTITPSTFDASISHVGRWEAGFLTSISALISNLTPGRTYMLYVRNTNSTARFLSVLASATNTGHVSVNFSNTGGLSLTGVTLSATSGTAMIFISNVGGSFIGSVF